MKFRVGDCVRTPDRQNVHVTSVGLENVATDNGGSYPFDKVALIARPVLAGDVLRHPTADLGQPTTCPVEMDFSASYAVKMRDLGWTHEDGAQIYAVNVGKMLPSIKLPDNWIQNASVGTIREPKLDGGRDAVGKQIDGPKARLEEERVTSAKLRDELVPLKDENTRLKCRVQELESELYRMQRRK